MPKNYEAEKNNPCLKEQELSYKCLSKNNFDHGKCELYYANYNNCKEFWNSKNGSLKYCVLCPNRSAITDTQTDDGFERITYHRFPTNPQRQDQWLKQCELSRESFPTLTYKFVCSNHFAPECFERDMRAELLYGIKRMALKRDALPTILTTRQHLKRQLNTQSSEEEDRQKRKEEVDKLLNGQIPVTEEIVNPFRKRNIEDTPCLPEERERMSHSELLQRIEDLEQETMNQRKHIAQLQRTIDRKTEKINFAKAEMVNTAIALQELKDHENRHVNERITEILSGRFGEGQLATIMAGMPDRTEESLLQVLWTENELVEALRLRCISKEAYEFVRKQLRYPLPDASQIERWIHSVYLETGHNATTMRILQLRACELKDVELICTLNLLHINTPVRYHYDRKRDQIVGPRAQLHCLTVQGIFASWQQIVYVDFDLLMGRELVEKIVTDLHHTGYRVVSITTGCDREAANMWCELNVSNEQPCVRHPVTGHSIYVYACPDQTLVAIHRALIEDGFLMQENNLPITSATLMPLLNTQQSFTAEPGSSTIYERYLSRKVLQNIAQDSALSREFISPTTTNALKSLAIDEDDDGGVLSTLTTLFDLFVDWYDLCTASDRSTEHSEIGQPPITNLPYGVCEDEQNIVLDGMVDVMETIRCLNSDNDFLPQAVLMSINSMRKLLADLRVSYPEHVKGIPMQRMSRIPMNETVRKLQQILTQHNSQSHGQNPSVNDVLFHLCSSVVSAVEDPHVTNTLLQLGGFMGETSHKNLRRQDDPPDPDVRNVTDNNACEFLTHLAVSRLGHKYDYLGKRSITIEHTNAQYAIKPSVGDDLSSVTPSVLWTEQAKRLESYLRGTIQEKKPGLVKGLIDYIDDRHPQMGRDLVELYVRKRIAIKLQTLNSKLDAAKQQTSS
uniref:THAP-type domain-containing protein n=1 Tax=Anopheles culicifacies TaxID=139723 RepID=A0A182M397_9DIPT